jgi:hypothetical protein
MFFLILLMSKVGRDSFYLVMCGREEVVINKPKEEEAECYVSFKSFAKLYIVKGFQVRKGQEIQGCLRLVRLEQARPQEWQ